MIDMTGKTCLVTGATSGTGYVTALELARAGATVVMLNRNPAKAAAAREKIVAETGSDRVHLITADLAEMAQVRRAAAEFLERFDRLDVLVNNAGALVTPRRETADGLEATFAGNYLGHFLLTELLLDRLKASAPARIINVSSVAHSFAKLDFGDLQSVKRPRNAYGLSKLLQILSTRELAARLAGTGVTVNAMHPGAVISGFLDGIPGWLRPIARVGYRMVGVSPEAGADTIVWLATAPEVADVTGRYFVKRKAVATKGASNDMAAAKRLLAESERLAGRSSQNRVGI